MILLGPVTWSIDSTGPSCWCGQGKNPRSLASHGLYIGTSRWHQGLALRLRLRLPSNPSLIAHPLDFPPLANQSRCLRIGAMADDGSTPGGIWEGMWDFIADMTSTCQTGETGSGSGSGTQGKFIFRGGRAFAAVAEAAIRYLISSGRDPARLGTSGEISPEVAQLLRMHLEKIEKKTDYFVNTVEQLVISIRSSVNSSVRNEIHMKRIEDRVISIEAKVEDAFSSAKEILDFKRQNNLLTEERYSYLKSALDSVIRELKSNKAKTPEAVEKTLFQKCGEALDYFDNATKFPDQVREQVNRVIRYAAAIEALLLWIAAPYSSQETKQLACNPEELKATPNGMSLIAGTYSQIGKKSSEIKQLACNLEELKKTCNGMRLIDGTYSEIGKKASELLYQFYVPGVTAVLLMDASDEPIFHLPMNNRLMADVTLESKATLDNNCTEMILNVKDLYFPYVKGSLTAPLPWRSPQAHLHLLHDFGAIDAKVDLTGNPIMNLSCLFGVKAFSVGGDLAVNTAGVLSKYDAGASIIHKDFCVSFKLQDRFQKASASLFGKFRLVSFALEYVFDKSPPEKEKEADKEKKETRKPTHKVIAGVSGMLNPSTELKAFLDTEFFAGGAIQHRRRPNSAVALSCKVDLKDMRRTPQFGMSLEFGLKSW